MNCPHESEWRTDAWHALWRLHDVRRSPEYARYLRRLDGFNGGTR